MYYIIHMDKPNTLQEFSSDIVRQNWLQNKAEIMDYHYDILWESLEKKMDIHKTDVYYILLRKFIDEREQPNHQTHQTETNLINNNTEIQSFEKMGVYIERKDENTLVIKGLDGEDRKNIHLLCDKIGLHHQSISHPKKKHKRSLHIYLPTMWLWEYTERNPYSKSKEFYEQREQERQKKEKEHEEKLSRKYCYECGRTGLETDLFCSVYIRELYCNDCLETTSDGDGGMLGDHKFEPLYYRGRGRF
jgi:hypothetical protein